MIKLFAFPQDDSPFIILDTLGSENIDINYQIDDIRDVSKKQGSYSKNFKLPATKNNNTFFDKYYNLDENLSSFDEFSLCRIILEINGISVIEGFLKLLSTITTEGETYYNVAIFNEVVTLKQALGDLVICDLDFSDIDHSFTETNVQDSCTATGLTLTNGNTSIVPFYPLMNTGGIYSGGNNIYHDSNLHRILHLQLKYVLDKIFEIAGLNVQSSFFDSTDFKNIYFDCGGESDTGNNYGFTNISASKSQNNQYTVAVPQFAYNNFWVDGGGYDSEAGDTNNQFSGTIFTATQDMTINVDVLSSFHNASANTQTVNYGIFSATVQLPNSPGFGYQTIGSLNVPPTSSVNNYAQFTYSFSITLQAGDSIQFWMSAPSGYIVQVNAQIPPNNFNPPLQNNIQIQPQILNATNSAICARIGDIKLIDIISDVFKMFNLSTEQLGQNSIRIENYDNFIARGVELDWTYKLDNRQIKVEPVDIPQRMVFSMAKDSKDHLYEVYEDTHLSTYGEQIIVFDVENGKEIKIENKLFAGANIEWIGLNNPQNTFPVSLTSAYKFGTGGIVPFKNKPRLVYKNNDPYLDANTGIEQKDYIYQFNSTAYEQTIHTAIPYSDRSDSVDTDSNLLLYSTPANWQEFMYGGGDTTSEVSTNNLFNKYWYAYLAEKYNKDVGKIFVARFNLTPADISNFSFADTIRVKNQLYRVNTISYNTDQNELAKVELLKI